MSDEIHSHVRFADTPITVKTHRHRLRQMDGRNGEQGRRTENQQLRAGPRYAVGHEKAPGISWGFL